MNMTDFDWVKRKNWLILSLNNLLELEFPTDAKLSYILYNTEAKQSQDR